MSSRGTQLREPFTINLHAILTMLYANLFKLTMGSICELYEQTAMLPLGFEKLTNDKKLSTY